MKNSRAKSATNIQPKQLRSFLVNTRTLLVSTQIFFKHDCCESQVNRRINEALQVIDAAGRQIDDQKLIDISCHNFRS